MKKSVQKITAVMLTLLLLASIIPLNSMIYVEAATTDGGKVNDTISWNYNDGALTISGSGEMPNYKTTNSYYDGITTDAPWGAYLNVIRTVIVSGSVSNIGDCCFSDCPSLSSVTLCSSIERIGTSAFARCVSLSRITLPESLAEINRNAFIGCTKLDEVLIPDSVTFIGSSAFQLCSSLSQIKLSANLKEICSYSFYLCKSLTSIEIPNSVSEIGGNAFRECNRIQEIVIPQSVSYIWVTAFFNCSSLKKATIYNNSVGFGKNVFSGCNSDFKLYGYLNSTSQTYASENGYSFVALDGDGTEITPTNPEVIDKQDNQNIITAVKSIRTKMKKRECTVEGTFNLFATSADTAMKEIEKQIFAYTSDAQEGDYLRDNCLSYSYSYSTSTVSGNRVLKYKYIFEYKTTYEQEQVVSINVSQILSHLSLSGLSNYEKAEKIYDYIVKNVSYDYQHYLDSSYIPQFTAYAALVDKKAVCEGYSLLFYRIAVEAGITCRIVSGKVGNSAHAWNLLKLDDLYYCIDTTFASSGNNSDSYFLKGSITFKDHILNGEFTSEQYKKEVPISDFDYVDSSNIKTVGSGVLNAAINWKVNEFAGKNGINQYALVITGSGATPDYYSNSYLPWNSWKNKITSVVVESSVSAIGNYIFANMTNLESAQIASSVISLGDYAFYNCPNLSSIQVTESTQFFGKCAIGGKYGETTWEYIPTQNKLIISGNGKMGEPYKNKDTLEMTSEKVPWNRLASTITDVEIKNGVKNISSFAFSGFSSLSTVSMPKSISTIETSAFEYCKSLTYICLPQSVSEIGHYAFRYCEGLRNIHIPSTVRKIGVNVFYNCPYLHEFYFYGDAPSFENNALYNNEVITAFYDKSTSGWSSVKTKFNKVKFESWTPDEYDDSGKNTGDYGIKYATSGKYGENVYWNFDENTGVLNITGSGSLQEPITISSTDADGTINIFYHTGAVPWNPFLLKIKSVNIDDGITDLTRYAFFCLQNAKSISIPDSVTNIGHAAFEKCYSLLNLNLGEKTSRIENEAFLDCNGLQSIYIPSALKSFGDDAFKNTPSLKDIYYEGTQSQWNLITKGNNSNYLKNVTIHYNSNKPTPDTSTFEFSLSGKKYFILNKEGTLNVSYQSSVNGQVLNELTNIKWTNSNPEIATVSGLDTGIADTGNNKVSVMATVKAHNVGSSTIVGTSPDGRKASFTINVEPEIKPGGPYQISKETEITLCSINLNTPDLEYLNDYASKLTITPNNNGVFSVKNKTTRVSNHNKSLEIIYKLYPETEGTDFFSISSPLGQCVQTSVISNNGYNRGFICNIDGNSFKHSSGIAKNGTLLPDDGIYGFYNIRNHEINSDLLRAKILSAASSESEISELLEAMESEWHGSCYGLATVIGLTYRNDINLDDISDASVENFQSLVRPCDNRKLLDAIEYYQLSQQLKNFGTKSDKCVSTYFDFLNGVFNEYNLSNIKSNDDFYRSLIQAVKDEYMVILGYSEKDGSGHAVLTCGLEEKNNEYIIKIYDENDRVDFDKLIIIDNNGKLTATYECTQNKNEDLMSELVEMDYMSLSALKDIDPFPSKKSVDAVGAKQSMLITVPINQKFRLKNENGKQLVFDGENFSGEIEIFGVYNIHNSNNDKIKIEITKSDKLEFTPLSDNAEIIVSDQNNYYSLSAGKINSANFNLGNGIDVNGSNYEFKTGINHYNSAGKIEVVSFSGSAKGNTTISSEDNNQIIINSNQYINNLSVDLISENDYQNIVKDEKVLEYTVSNNYIVGDVNLDGTVNITDATTVQKYLVGTINLNDLQIKVTDTNGDDKVDISDATTIQKYLAVLIDHFGQPANVSLSSTTLPMYVGDTKTLTATITPNDAPKKDITWTSSDKSIATVSNGIVTAISPGTVTITVKTYNGKAARCTVTVKPIEPRSISLNKSTLTLYEGDTYQLSATINPSNAANKTVTWTSSNTSVVSVDSNGRVSAKAIGSATITAKTVNNKVATCTITVSPIEAVSIGFNNGNIYLKPNGTYRITAVIKPDNVTDKSVLWESSNKSVATVDGYGNVFAKSPGTATITAWTSNNKSTSCMVTVLPVSVSSISLNSYSVTLNEGESYQLSAAISPADATDKTLIWRSSDSSIATVSNTGLVVAKSSGTVSITAESNNGKTAVCNVTVIKSILPESIEVLPPRLTLTVGETFELNPKIKPDNAEDKSVTWSSSKTNAVSVDSNGKITAKKAGMSSIITARTVNGITSTVTVDTVNKAEEYTKYWSFGVKYDGNVYTAPYSQGPYYVKAGGEDLYYILNLDSELYIGAKLKIYITSGSSGIYDTHTVTLNTSTYDNKSYRGNIPISQYLNYHSNQYIRVYTEVILANGQVVKPANLGTNDAIYLYMD